MATKPSKKSSSKSAAKAPAKAPAKTSSKSAPVAKETAKEVAGAATKAPAAARGSSPDKLQRQLEKIEKQVAEAREEQAELKKAGRELPKLARSLEKTRDELENFRDWTRTYFEQITAKFEALASDKQTGDKKGQTRLMDRLAALETRLAELAAAPTASAQPVTTTAAATPVAVRQELQELRHWISGVRDELHAAMGEVREEVRTARSGLDQLSQRSWQPIGWQEYPPGVL
jgi:chromosome segregation ATPase